MSEDKQETSFAAEIWRTLSKVDVNQHIKIMLDKNGNVIKDNNGKPLRYLPWASCWGMLMDHYPNSYYDFKEKVSETTGTIEVWCELLVTKSEGSQCARSMWLPVMDYRNNAVKNPDLRQISDTRMRCLVKCIAMFGLGIHIYAGEDAPMSADPADDGFETSEERVKHWLDQFEQAGGDKDVRTVTYELAKKAFQLVTDKDGWFNFNQTIKDIVKAEQAKREAEAQRDD